MTVRTFVDTNIWVYALDRRDQDKQAVALDALRMDPSSIVVSTQVLGELYVTLRRLGAQVLGEQDARSAVEALRRFTVVPIEDRHVTTALDFVALRQLSYWDALVVAAAHTAGCSRILTEDLTPGAIIGGVRIDSPFADRHGNRLSESPAPYSTRARAWDDASLREALATYAEVCKRAGMRPSAAHSYWDYARRFQDWREGRYPRDAAHRPVPDRIVNLDDLDAEVAAYIAAVRAAGLSDKSVETYGRHAGFFVRWLGGQFEPGSRIRHT